MNEDKKLTCFTKYIENDQKSGMKGVRFEEFVKEVEQSANQKNDFSLHEVKDLIKFCTDQIGFWSTKWSFSSTCEPDMIAKEQMSGWEDLWERLTNILLDKVPEVRELQETMKNQVVLKYALEMSLRYNKQRLFGQTQATIMSRAAILLNKIGFSVIATSLYTAALYPKGTVGRLD